MVAARWRASQRAGGGRYLRLRKLFPLPLTRHFRRACINFLSTASFKKVQIGGVGEVTVC